MKKWPEKEQRLSRWLSPEDAALLVDEPSLATVLNRLSREKKSVS